MPNGDLGPPLMHWNMNDFLQCLEVEPKSSPHVWTFDVFRNGLRLLLTIHDHPGNVHITVLRESVPIIDLEMAACRGVRGVKREDVDCLEFSPARLYNLSHRFDSETIVDYGIRVATRPEISIRFFELGSVRASYLINHL
jgi:hypothetical protein